MGLDRQVRLWEQSYCERTWCGFSRIQRTMDGDAGAARSDRCVFSGCDQNCSEVKRPSYLSVCDADARLFPLDWKVAHYRLNGGCDKGYTCPRCEKTFCGPEDFEELHRDHIVSVSSGGLTVWENLQLLCGRCNLSKGK